MATASALHQQARMLLTRRFMIHVSRKPICNDRGFSSTRLCAAKNLGGNGNRHARHNVVRLIQAAEQKEAARTSDMHDRMMTGERKVTSKDITMILPETFVKPPFHRFPFSSPRKLVLFTWGWIRARVAGMLCTSAFKWSSKPSIWTRALWKRDRRGIIRQAKALHRAMSEALATGDKRALDKACVTPLSSRLGAVIDARPRSRRLTWELVRYKSARIAALTVLTIPAKPERVHVYQAVVRIKSRQRLVEYDQSPHGGGRMVPGGDKEADLVENVVLTNVIDSDTYQLSDWRIWGTVEDSTPESLAEDREIVRSLQQEEVAKHKILHN